MKTAIAIHYYDGRQAKAHQAQLFPYDKQGVMLHYGVDVQRSVRYFYQDMQFMAALGKNYAVVELPDDARIEFLSAVPDWFELRQKKLWHSIWFLERSPLLIGCLLLIVLFTGFATLKWGIPSAAAYVARHLPDNTMYAIGERAEAYLLTETKKTQLSLVQQQAIQQKYLKSIATENTVAKLIFVKGGEMGANAFALPNNSIVLTDELVKLAGNDQEILTVLAHEQGHLVQKHSLQQALSGIGSSILWIALTGDSSDLLTTLPVLMVGASYSRDFEAEADLYALELLHAKKIPTIHFADFLEKMAKLEQISAENALTEGVFSSHPNTAERIKKAQAFARAHPDV